MEWGVRLRVRVRVRVRVWWLGGEGRRRTSKEMG